MLLKHFGTKKQGCCNWACTTIIYFFFKKKKDCTERQAHRMYLEIIPRCEPNGHIWLFLSETTMLEIEDQHCLSHTAHWADVPGTLRKNGVRELLGLYYPHIRDKPIWDSLARPLHFGTNLGFLYSWKAIESCCRAGALKRRSNVTRPSAFSKQKGRRFGKRTKDSGFFSESLNPFALAILKSSNFGLCRRKSTISQSATEVLRERC